MCYQTYRTNSSPKDIHDWVSNLQGVEVILAVNKLYIQGKPEERVGRYDFPWGSIKMLKKTAKECLLVRINARNEKKVKEQAQNLRDYLKQINPDAPLKQNETIDRLLEVA